MMPSTSGSGHNGAQPEKSSTTSRQLRGGSGPREAAILSDQPPGYGTGEWLSDLMACYDFWDWRVTEECPEAFSGVHSDEEQAISDALMRYYNH